MISTTATAGTPGSTIPAPTAATAKKQAPRQGKTGVAFCSSVRTPYSRRTTATSAHLWRGWPSFARMGPG